MRTLVAAILAVPVIATTYLPRSIHLPAPSRRLLLGGLPIAVALLVVIGVPDLGARTTGSSTASGSAMDATPLDVAALSVPPLASPAIAAAAPTGTVAGLAGTAGVADPLPSPAVLAAAVRADGAVTAGPAVASTPAVVATALIRPKVVRFRPVAGATSVVRTAAVSVRFTQAMAHAVTQAAFSVVVNGTRVTGSVRWAEGSTVLVVTPAKPFPYGATVRLAVSAKARSAAGAPIAAASSATFRVVRAPTSTATTTAVQRTTTIPRPAASGLHAVELYYLSLMNCTRTGGWVSSSGQCTGAGTRDVKPLVLDAGISDKVSRPYAAFLASRDICSHFADGNPGTRLSRAGYRNWDWAENIGCLSTDPYRSMLLTHLFYQSERATGGGHYRNLMNPLYDRVGIGVVVTKGVLRLVIDFYHP